MGRTLFLPTSLKIVAAVGVAFVLWGLVLASPAHAAILTVTNTNDAGAGSLRQAIIDANAAAGADTINLPSGTYLLSSQLPTITSPVTIDGDSPNPTIDGGTSVRLFFVASGAQLSLNELTLTQGKTASNDGGAIRNEGTLVVANSIFSGNTSNNQGGGIFSTGTLEVSDSTFSGNSANLDGGAITSEGTLEVNNSTLSGNTSTSFKGGAIANHGNGTATVTNSTFSKNSAQQGGAISNQHTLEVTNSTFSDNKTHRGGGIDNAGSTATLTVNNSTFSGNNAAIGGGIANAGTLTVTNSTFSGNFAFAVLSGGIPGGGGIFHDGGTATLKNTIVANSTSGGNCSGTLTDAGYNLDTDGTCVDDTVTTSKTINPLLDPNGLQDNGGPTQTIALCSEVDTPTTDCAGPSDAIDAIPDTNGSTPGCGDTKITTDQRGVSRPQGAACDIGAYELDTPPSVTIDQASGQGDTTSASPIHFTAAFSEPVTGFDRSDVTLSGTAGATTAVVTEIDPPKDGTTYDVAVSGMSSEGTVIASIPAKVAQDFALHDNTASTSTDNTVTFIPNSPPVANADSASTNEDNPVTINVLGNDNDPDGDTLRVGSVTQPTHGSTGINGGGAEYTPAQDFNGTDSFNYTVSDGNGGEATATVTITVLPVNDAPGFDIPSSPNQTVNEDAGTQTVANFATNISPGPSNETGQNVSFVVTNDNDQLFSAQPSIASNGTTGTLTYTPAANKNGSATVTVKAKDDGGTPGDTSDDAESAEQKFTITVNSVNDAPEVFVAAGGSCGTNDRSGKINLTVNDSDGQAGSLKLSATSNNTTLVPNANVTFGGSGASRTLTATAVSGITGPATITVTVSEVGGGATGTPLAVTLKAGGNSNDTLSGTSGTDILLGQNGADTLSGLGGKDLLCGGLGNDNLSGGADDDTLSGSQGNDRLTGGTEADRFEGGPGTDTATDFNASQGDTMSGIP